MSVESIELEEMISASGAKIPGVDNIDLIKNVNIRLEVVVGETEISVGELFDLKENSVIALKNELGSPVNVLLDGKVVAKGELSAVGNNFGVRITKISR